MIIPALDLIDGKVVRLYQGDYAQKTVYSDDPQSQFTIYNQHGADWLHLVDLDGAKDVTKRQLNVIASLIANTTAKIQIGGGVRTEQDVKDLLGISIGTLRKYRITGKISYTKIDGILYYKYEDVIKLIESNKFNSLG